MNAVGTLTQQVNQLTICPITKKSMENPVSDPCGHTFESSAILERLKQKSVCPISEKPLTAESLIPNDVAKKLVEILKQQNSASQKVASPVSRVMTTEKEESKWQSMPVANSYSTNDDICWDILCCCRCCDEPYNQMSSEERKKMYEERREAGISIKL